MKHSDIIIIGGGAAGMMAAYGAASELRRSSAGKDTQVPEVTVLEKMPRPGRKIMITGKGRCNLTNACGMDTLFDSVRTNARFLYSAFYGFTNQDAVNFFEEEGLRLKTERGERVFPVSDKSADVLDTLRRSMKKAGVQKQPGQDAYHIFPQQFRKDFKHGFIIIWRN